MHFTEGIVLEQKDFKENDRVLSVFTKDYGIIKVLARGIRKSTSKLSSQIDLFSFVEISFVLGSGYKVLSGAYLKDGFFNLKQDLKKQKLAKDISSLLVKYFPKNEKEEDVFEILKKAFFYISKNNFKDADAKYFFVYFQYKVLESLGYEPEEAFIKNIVSKKNVKEEFFDKANKMFLRYFESIL